MSTPLPAFSAFGVELEFMIVSTGTLDVMPIADRVLGQLAGGYPGSRPPAEVIDGDYGWSNELVTHLLELKNPNPLPALAGVAEAMQERVERMNALLEPMGARLMPGGMHPWMRPSAETVLWPHHNAAIYAAYDRIFGCRSHGWANLQSQHLNLPFADDEEFARLHAAARLVLPILPAIAASSPFREGRAAGWDDSRLEAYSRHTAAVPSLTGPLVPESVSSQAQYQAEILQPIYGDLCALDPDGTLRHEWINARGAIARFDRNALEIRVLDTQECPAADLAVSALAADAVRYFFEGNGPALEIQQAFETSRLTKILLACAREAETTRIGDEAYLALLGYEGSDCEAGGLWADLATRLEAAAMPNVVLWRDHLDRILREGTLATRLLRAAGTDADCETLSGLYGRLCDCLKHGTAFSP